MKIFIFCVAEIVKNVQKNRKIDFPSFLQKSAKKINASQIFEKLFQKNVVLHQNVAKIPTTKAKRRLQYFKKLHLDIVTVLLYNQTTMTIFAFF